MAYTITERDIRAIDPVHDDAVDAMLQTVSRGIEEAFLNTRFTPGDGNGVVELTAPPRPAEFINLNFTVARPNIEPHDPQTLDVIIDEVNAEAGEITYTLNGNRTTITGITGVEPGDIINIPVPGVIPEAFDDPEPAPVEMVREDTPNEPIADFTPGGATGNYQYNRGIRGRLQLRDRSKNATERHALNLRRAIREKVHYNGHTTKYSTDKISGIVSVYGIPIVFISYFYREAYLWKFRFPRNSEIEAVIANPEFIKDGVALTKNKILNLVRLTLRKFNIFTIRTKSKPANFEGNILDLGNEVVFEPEDYINVSTFDTRLDYTKTEGGEEVLTQTSISKLKTWDAQSKFNLQFKQEIKDTYYPFGNSYGTMGTTTASTWVTSTMTTATTASPYIYYYTI